MSYARVTLALWTVISVASQHPSAAPASAVSGMVSSAPPLATEAGLEILRAGGERVRRGRRHCCGAERRRAGDVGRRRLRHNRRAPRRIERDVVPQPERPDPGGGGLRRVPCADAWLSRESAWREVGLDSRERERVGGDVQKVWPSPSGVNCSIRQSGSRRKATSSILAAPPFAGGFDGFPQPAKEIYGREGRRWRVVTAFSSRTSRARCA